MRLRTALNEYERDRDDRFPGEFPTVSGALSGSDRRLVHVERTGAFRDHSAALSGLYGVDRSRFGIETPDGAVRWFDDIEPVRQHYYDDTALVETEYDAGEFTVHQFDLTLERTHLTHVGLRGEVPDGARLTAFLTFAPDGSESGVGQLIHRKAGPDDATVVEAFHRSEHDYVTASTGIAAVRGQVPERFEELLDEDPVEFPRRVPRERYEDHHLSGDLVVSAPLERSDRAARTTLVTHLADHDETTRPHAIEETTGAARQYRDPDSLRAAARDRCRVTVPDDAPRSESLTDDFRALGLLYGPAGGRIAGPEFDPFSAGSGGYGYTWFRDDAETARHLLLAADRLDLDLGDWPVAAARLYCDAQLSDGRWPHRVWAEDGSIAPGWAHGAVENAPGPEYQADQAASVTTYLATLLREEGSSLDPDDSDRIRRTLSRAVDGLDDDLSGDGLPEPCQNCWEDMEGRFTNTAATFLEAYAAVARAPVPEALADRATDRAGQVLAGLEALWTGDHYALGIRDGELDDRLDAGSFALVEAAIEYDRAVGLPDERLDRIVHHLETAIAGLRRDAGEVAGLIRYEGDEWRTADQDREKVWSVATAWGALAAGRLAELLAERDRGRDADRMRSRSAELYELVQPGGPFANRAGFLAEQAFDDGHLDSATPLGWAHALRSHATAVLAAPGALPSVGTPSGPADRPRWTTAEKYGFGTVADYDRDDPSKVWFTLTEGALTELRYPRVELMNVRSIDFLVTDPDGGYTARTHNETRRDDDSETLERRVEPTTDEALAYRQTVTETGDGHGHEWRLAVEYVADPEHDAVVADVDFEAQDDRTYEVYAVANTALVNTGDTDRAYRLGEDGDYRLVARDATAFDGGDDDPYLVDEEGEPYSVAVALAPTSGFDWASVDVAGSEGMTSLFREGRRSDSTERVENDNVVLVGRLGTGRGIGETVAVGFAREADTAGALGEARGSLARGFDLVSREYVASWQSYLEDVPVPDVVAGNPELRALYDTSLMVLRAASDKTFDGAGIASPSVPWGEAVVADEQRGYGYNFVWSRDLYQVCTVALAIEDLETAREALAYVYEHQQDEQGFIPQNTYLHGRTRWGGEQMDNISFPAVMAYQLADRGLGLEDADYDYEHVRRSTDYVARNGPATAQERWEEESGYSPSTIAAEIAGLACAGKLAIDRDQYGDALAWLGLADDWAERVEDWTVTTTGTDRLEPPYYVRITRDGDPDAGTRRTLANDGPTLDERAIIDAGFLELVRLGIKPADDPRIQRSVEVVDQETRVETPHGPGFYRYTGDGYGERQREDPGGPWAIAAAGKGRLWPIFTGERGEYELVAGTDSGPTTPERLLETMAGFANDGRMIPEQVWDREASTVYNWTFGEGTGAATPLAWSHAGFVRLAHGIDAGRPVETPAFVRERYVANERGEGPDLWTDAAFEGGTVVVTVRTDAAAVAIKTPAETAYVEPTEGEFVVRVDVGSGENEVVVAAADHTDLERANTTVERRTL
jgi:glucan 1,4-alpha-glucosidase